MKATHRFPNKMLAETYEQAKGKTFTWHPTYQMFTDDTGCTDYNYSAMLWLYENGYIEKLPFNFENFTSRFKVTP